MKRFILLILLAVTVIGSVAHAQRCRPGDRRQWCKDLEDRTEAINSAAFGEAFRQAAEYERNRESREIEEQRQRSADIHGLGGAYAKDGPNSIVFRDIWYLWEYEARDLDVWANVNVNDMEPFEAFVALTNAERDFDLREIGVPANNKSYHTELNNFRISIRRNPNGEVAVDENGTFILDPRSSTPYVMSDINRLGLEEGFINKDSDIPLNEVALLSLHKCSIARSSMFPETGLRTNIHCEEPKGRMLYGSNMREANNSFLFLLATTDPYSVSCGSISHTVCYLTEHRYVIGSLQHEMKAFLEEWCHIREDGAIKCEAE